VSLTSRHPTLLQACTPCQFPTEDDALAAHFEHTIAVTQVGPEILTTV
jgi:methionine aminopeptidase